MILFLEHLCTGMMQKYFVIPSLIKTVPSPVIQFMYLIFKIAHTVDPQILGFIVYSIHKSGFMFFLYSHKTL